MRFIVFGDSKGKEDGINKKILHSLLKESRKLIPSADFIVILGDSIAGSTDSNTFLTQVNNFRNIVSSYYENTPLLPIIVNHEENACSENNKRKLVLSIHQLFLQVLTLAIALIYTLNVEILFGQ
ncbi:hypothetical protein [Clostridium cuniculi]|uniref:hypothetical protein n=1 Tax=Clostridium cuniculi TaxID=2548455 RepID=UPI001FA9EDB1|nr:hypothetical protein [Clostridium cuniculi]